MSLLYLDTSRLQNLAKYEYPSHADCLALANKLKDANITLIYSLMHTLEIIDADDDEQIMQMGRFMESLPHLWILNTDERIKHEILNAWKIFCSESPTKKKIFYNRLIEIFPLTPNPLEFRLAMGNKKLSDFFLLLCKNEKLKKLNQRAVARLPQWSRNNSEAASQNDWVKKSKVTFKEELHLRVYKYLNASEIRVNKEQIEAFTDYLLKNPNLIYSFSIDFYVKLILLRDGGKTWGINDIGDLTHHTVMPYVDIYCCDNEMLNKIQSTFKRFPKIDPKKTQLVSKISEIPNFPI